VHQVGRLPSTIL